VWGDVDVAEDVDDDVEVRDSVDGERDDKGDVGVDDCRKWK